MRLQQSRPALHAGRSIAALAACVLGMGLAGPALAADDPAAASSASGGLAVASSGQEAPAAVSAAEATPSAEPAAVALVEKPDGSLAVERHAAGTPAAAARVAGELAKQPRVVASSVEHAVHALVNPGDDTFYGCQWALQSGASVCGDTVPLAKPALKAASAWTRSTGSGVVVAVLDSGVKADHEDLAGKVLSGADLVGAASNVGRKDYYGHGTHVAGIIAAADNTKGIVGLAPNVKILPVRVLNARGAGTDTTVADGIIWAVKHGADVINLSLGGPSSSSVQTAAVNYALRNGVVVVASAGNSAQDGNPTMYPAAIPGVIAVGASTATGAIASFSERKSYVALAAPGHRIVSSYIDGQVDADGYEICPTEDDGDNGTIEFARNGCYALMSGTSQAAPHVSAAAALLLAKNKNLGVAAVGAYLTGSATDAGKAGRDTAYGFGHLNINKGLDLLAAGPRPTSLSVRASDHRVKVGTTVSLTATASSNGYRLARRKVEFLRKTISGSWAVIGTGVTNGKGQAKLATKISRHGHFRVRAVAVPGLAGRISTTDTVVAVAKITRTGTSPSADRVTVKAQVYPKIKVKVKLQRKVSGDWRTISTKYTGSTGAVTFKAKAPSGKQYFRVISADSKLARAGKSSTLKISVR